MRHFVRQVWARIWIALILLVGGLAATFVPWAAAAGIICAVAGLVALASAFWLVREIFAIQRRYEAFRKAFRPGYDPEIIEAAQLAALWPRMREIAKGSMGGDFGRGRLSEENVRALAMKNRDSILGVFRRGASERTLAGFSIAMAADGGAPALEIAAVYARGAVARGAIVLLLKIYLLDRFRRTRSLRTLTARPATKAAKRLLGKYNFEPLATSPEVWSLDRERLLG